MIWQVVFARVQPHHASKSRQPLADEKFLHRSRQWPQCAVRIVRTLTVIGVRMVSADNFFVSRMALRNASWKPMMSALSVPAPRITRFSPAAVLWQAAQVRPTNCTGTGVAFPGRRWLTEKPTGHCGSVLRALPGIEIGTAQKAEMVPPDLAIFKPHRLGGQLLHDKYVFQRRQLQTE